jgi:hypothetical protein
VFMQCSAVFGVMAANACYCVNPRHGGTKLEHGKLLY